MTNLTLRDRCSAGSESTRPSGRSSKTLTWVFTVCILNALAVAHAAHATLATVSTDKLDYSPGQTVVISGAGWQPGEAVELDLHEEPFVYSDRIWSVTADGDGEFTDTTYLVE